MKWIDIYDPFKSIIKKNVPSHWELLHSKLQISKNLINYPALLRDVVYCSIFTSFQEYVSEGSSQTQPWVRTQCLVPFWFSTQPPNMLISESLPDLVCSCCYTAPVDWTNSVHNYHDRSKIAANNMTEMVNEHVDSNKILFLKKH